MADKDLRERVAVVEQRQNTLEKAVADLATDVRKLVAALSSLKGAAWVVAILWPVYISIMAIIVRAPGIWK